MPLSETAPHNDAQILHPLQKRPAQDHLCEAKPSKRAKYASTACNDCKRCKVKCIRPNDDPTCQRCASMGQECVIIPTAAQMAKDKDRRAQQTCTSRYLDLAEQVSSLRQQLSTITATVSALVERHPIPPDRDGLNRRTACSQACTSTYADSDIQRDDKAKQPNFVGPTRSAFGFHVAETSLARMGLAAGQKPSLNHSPTPSIGDVTPIQSTHIWPAYTPVNPGVDVLLGFSEAELTRLLGVYQEEVVSVYPILNPKYLVTHMHHLLDIVRVKGVFHSVASPKLGAKDVHILRVAIATAMTHETHGEHPVREELIRVVDDDLGRITSVTNVELKDLQIMGMLSIYFCHIEEELFAWRAIGRAVRHALEMGLNHRRSLFDNFPDLESRQLATQIFWVVYQLDRRWSFGTSLSFALHDKDIDSDLPEPGPDFPYSKCMIAYGRLCSRIWEALPPYGSESQRIPQETEEYLDFITQNWRASIPSELRHRSTNDEQMREASAPPRILHRLRTLLHLRGNYMRLLIHRHHVFEHEDGKFDTSMIHLVVDVAKDSIQVLVDFNRTSDIYKCQPSIYHHYLVSALGVLLLAVCHTPTEFTETCRLSFVAAIELLKSLSRHGTASRKIWRSISGVLPFLRSLNPQRDDQSGDCEAREPDHSTTQSGHITQQQQPILSEITTGAAREVGLCDAPHVEPWSSAEPDIFNISSDLLDLYDAFGAQATDAQPLQYDVAANNLEDQPPLIWDMAEISRHFEGLI